MINTLNKGKEEINRLTLQNQNVQNKAFSLLEKCFNDTSSLRFQIMDLKKEAEQNEINNKNKPLEIPRQQIRPRRTICAIF